GTLTRNDLFESESEVFAFRALKFNFPVFATFLADLEHELSFAGGVKTKIQIVANYAPIDLYYSVTAFEVHFGAQTVGRHLADLDPAAANVRNGRCNCKLVHNSD